MEKPKVDREKYLSQVESVYEDRIELDRFRTVHEAIEVARRHELKLNRNNR